MEISNVTFTYPEAQKTALDHISFSIPEGSFTVICGPSGCGKTTLLRLLKPEIRPHGEFHGTIYYSGKVLTTKHSSSIGMIFQDSEQQIVMENVRSELTFGMENLGLSSAVMNKRLAEMVQFFDLEPLLDRLTAPLSGGEKQLINLTSVLLMQPRLLLLDEPTAQLDPVASKQLLHMLERLNQEWGITIVMVEHRLEEVLSLADQLLILQDGKILESGTPNEVLRKIWNQSSEFREWLPTATKLALSLPRQNNNRSLPIHVKQFRSQWLEQWKHFSSSLMPSTTTKPSSVIHPSPILQLKDVSFRYQYESNDVLQFLQLTIFQGEALAILGNNGSGKSTLLKMIAQQLLPQRGKCHWSRKVSTALLPQNPKSLFSQESFDNEIKAISTLSSIDLTEVEKYVKLLEIGHLRNQHPHDLSGGELQRVALALLLSMKPELLLLDEPTKGLDPSAKKQLGQLLKLFQNEGTTIVLVTHDLEFTVQFADRCALLFEGEIHTIAEPSQFFTESLFYTTILQRLLRGTHWSHLLTWEELIDSCPDLLIPS